MSQDLSVDDTDRQPHSTEKDLTNSRIVEESGTLESDSKSKDEKKISESIKTPSAVREKEASGN